MGVGVCRPPHCFCVLRALTCPSWCIRTPPGCPPPRAGEAKLRPAYPANAVIILLENTCPCVHQARKSIMTSLPSENETYLVSPACGGDVEAVRPRQRGHEKVRARKTQKSPFTHWLSGEGAGWQVQIRPVARRALNLRMPATVLASLISPERTMSKALSRGTRSGVRNSSASRCMGAGCSPRAAQM